MSRNIRNEFGQIGTEYRLWWNMKRLAAREQIMYDVIAERDAMVLDPGTMKQCDIERLAASLIGDVYMIAIFSPADASRLSPEKYEEYRARYEERI